jgi:hypothetical protein
VATFGGLFVAADAVVEHYVVSVSRLDVGTIIGHLGWFSSCSLIGMGLLWSMLAMEAPPAPPLELPERHRLNTAEVAAPLATLVVVFGVFALVQVRFLFAGHSFVERTAGLTYASYARRGFFELVVAVTLVLPVILAFDWLRRKDRTTSKAFPLFSGLLLALLLVVVLSAVQRLRVYESTYGLTELRFYALAFLALIVLQLGVCAATVLRLRPQAFLFTSLLLIGLWLGALAALSPEGVIAQVNIERAAEGKRFDADYLARLGADAVPAIVRNFESIPARERCRVASDLLLRWTGSQPDWRSWTWSAQAARDEVGEHRNALAGACGR